MNRTLSILLLVVLAGCGSMSERHVAASDPGQPVLAVVHSEDVKVGVVPDIRNDTPMAPDLARQPAEHAPPLVVFAESRQSSTDATPWAELLRRIVAWGDPLRRSMEPYCEPEGQVKP